MCFSFVFQRFNADLFFALSSGSSYPSRQLWDLRRGILACRSIYDVCIQAHLSAISCSYVHSIFAEVGRTNVFTTRIWFDCLWSGLFFLLNISMIFDKNLSETTLTWYPSGAASVITALLPSQMCKSMAWMLVLSLHLDQLICHQTRINSPARLARRLRYFKALLGLSPLCVSARCKVT